MSDKPLAVKWKETTPYDQSKLYTTVLTVPAATNVSLLDAAQQRDHDEPRPPPMLNRKQRRRLAHTKRAR
jgi:hypothetical protein